MPVTETVSPTNKKNSINYLLHHLHDFISIQISIFKKIIDVIKTVDLFYTLMTSNRIHKYNKIAFYCVNGKGNLHMEV